MKKLFDIKTLGSQVALCILIQLFVSSPAHATGSLTMLGTGTNATVIQPADTGNYNMILPTSIGSPGQVLATDGTSSLSWVTASGSSSMADGTAAAPGLAFTNKTNTGIFRPGGATLAISTNGTEALRIDSAGRLGLGALLPTKNLSFNGNAAQTIWMENSTAAANGNSLTLQAGGAGTGNNRSGGDLILSSGAASGNGSSGISFQTVTSNQGTGSTVRSPTTKMVITANGNVGVETKLSV